jgi:endo-1,4-beta-xylanase
MMYELNKEGMRSFGLAIAEDLAGPWRRITDRYATGDQLKAVGKTQTWTEMVSHGELLRSGYNEQMEYEPNGCRWLIQGVFKKDSKEPYPSLLWKLGIISKVEEY